jgi:hypothetical protein
MYENKKRQPVFLKTLTVFIPNYLARRQLISLSRPCARQTASS